MALEKYTVKGFQAAQAQPPGPIVKKYGLTTEDYRELASLLNRVIVRISSNLVDFNSIRGSEVLEGIRQTFYQLVRLKVEQLIADQHSTHANRSTRPDATPHLQHLVLCQGDGGQAILEAYQLSQEQVQSGYRSYYYDKTIIHWFQPDESNELFQKLQRKPSPRIFVVPYAQGYEATPALHEQFVQASLRAYLGHPYLYIQSKESIYPEALKSIVQELKQNLSLIFEAGLLEGHLARDQVCLNIVQSANEISDMQITTFPAAAKAFYKGDFLPPRHFDQVIRHLLMGASYQLMGWFVFEGLPAKLPRHPQTLILPERFEQTFTAQQLYAILGHIATNLAEIRGVLPVIFDENNKGVLVWVGSPEMVDQAIREMIHKLKGG